jgi:hypothetical protein
MMETLLTKVMSGDLGAGDCREPRDCTGTVPGH